MTEEVKDPRDAVIAKLSIENEKLRNDLIKLYAHCKEANRLAVELSRHTDLYDVHLQSRNW